MSSMLFGFRIRMIDGDKIRFRSGFYLFMVKWCVDLVGNVWECLIKWIRCCEGLNRNRMSI